MLITKQSWVRILLFNLFIVAFLGFLMRYKISFEFPLLNQKNVQHAHSHFAFGGWVTQTLFFLLVNYLNKNKTGINFFKRYNKLLLLNLICAYGMLISFVIYGYNFISIIFSTSSIFVSFFFTMYYFRDLKTLNTNEIVSNWFKAALVYNVISSFGTFYLAYMMASKNFNQDLYLSSIYYYLHFQYNGWFTLACLGLFFDYLKIPSSIFLKLFQKITIWTCIPIYVLSLLWLKISIGIYAISIVAILIQTVFWFLFLFKTKKRISLKNHLLNLILKFILLSMSIKLILQSLSTIPALSKFAFGTRPVIIAYLHLVLLAIISLSLLFLLANEFLINNQKKIKTSLVIFVSGVLLNEILLATQGFVSIKYISIPFINEYLLTAAIILVAGAFLLYFFSKKSIAYD